MAKDRSFMAKVAKSQLTPSRQCPVCKEAINSFQIIQTEQNTEKKSWRFKKKYVGVCKCNEKDVIG